MVATGSKKDKKVKIERSASIIYWTFIIFVIILLLFLAYAEDISLSFLYVNSFIAVFVSFGIYGGKIIPLFRTIWKILALVFIFFLISIYIILNYYYPENLISFDAQGNFIYNRKIYHFYDYILNIFITYLFVVIGIFIINAIMGWFYWLKRL